LGIANQKQRDPENEQDILMEKGKSKGAQSINIFNCNAPIGVGRKKWKVEEL
jgi:hypothetical protein